MTNIPFIYKYQPKKLDQFEISNDFKQMINTLLEMDNMNILFIGNSGSGKTTLVKSILKKLGVNDEIKSPTFSIVNEYDHPSGPIYHFDLYRIEKIDELDVIGFEEYIDNCNICFIEWPEVGMEKIFGNYMQINLGHIDDNKREILITKK